MKFPLNLLTSLITLTAFTSAPASVRVLSVEDQRGRKAYTNPVWVRSP